MPLRRDRRNTLVRPFAPCGFLYPREYTLLYSPSIRPRGSEKTEIRWGEREESLLFWSGQSVRGSCDPFSNLFPFACVPSFLQTDRPRFSRVIPSRKNVRWAEEGRQNRKREREREKERGAERFRARGSGRNEDGPRERTTDDPALFAFY